MVAALEQLRTLLVGPGGHPIDPLKAEWRDIEAALAPQLDAGFAAQNPRHVDIMLMLAAALTERLRGELGAFWFQIRTTPHGAAVGFPGAVLVFSPIHAVFEALRRSNLSLLTGVVTELRETLARQPKPSPGAPDFQPVDYQRLFDPGFVQFVALDPAAVKATLGATAADTLRDFERGFAGLSPEIAAQSKAHLARKVQAALGRLTGASTLGDQIGRDPQLTEFVTLATAARAATGMAPAEFWEQLLLPLLHIGAAETIAEPDEDELASYRQGVDPVVLYVDSVPYRTPAADEDGLLGVFPSEAIGLVDRRWEPATDVRLLQIDPAVLSAITKDFDPAATRVAIERFAASRTAAAGGAPVTGEGTPTASASSTSPAAQPSLLDLILLLADDLKRVLVSVREKGWMLVLRFATEAEGALEPTLHDLRRALHARP